MVFLDSIGDIAQMGLNRNKLGNTDIDVFVDKVPEFVLERIALLKLCDVSTTPIGETIGRRLPGDVFTIYLSEEEYVCLKKLSRKG